MPPASPMVADYLRTCGCKVRSSKGGVTNRWTKWELEYFLISETSGVLVQIPVAGCLGPAARSCVTTKVPILEFRVGGRGSHWLRVRQSLTRLFHASAGSSLILSEKSRPKIPVPRQTHYAGPNNTHHLRLLLCGALQWVRTGQRSVVMVIHLEI